MIFRQSRLEDLDKIVEILKEGKRQQVLAGNPNQWSDTYPGRADVLEDLEHGESFVGIDPHSQEIVVTMCILQRPEPTYASIEGQWLDDQMDYVTVHRIASIQKGAGKQALQFALDCFGNVRIDTHKDNKAMLRVIEKLGFTHCGVVTMRDGTLREAFQQIKRSQS